MALLDGLATYLGSLGVATPGTNLFVGDLPHSPDTCAAIYHRGGDAPVRAMGPHGTPPIADQPTVQVVVRGATVPALEALQSAIVNALDHWTGMAGTTQVLYSGLAYAPVDVGDDENGRPVRSLVFHMKASR